jgi:hypothetical protein
MEHQTPVAERPSIVDALRKYTDAERQTAAKMSVLEIWEKWDCIPDSLRAAIEDDRACRPIHEDDQLPTADTLRRFDIGWLVDEVERNHGVRKKNSHGSVVALHKMLPHFDTILVDCRLDGATFVLPLM